MNKLKKKPVKNSIKIDPVEGIVLTNSKVIYISASYPATKALGSSMIVIAVLKRVAGSKSNSSFLKSCTTLSTYALLIHKNDLNVYDIR